MEGWDVGNLDDIDKLFDGGVFLFGNCVVIYGEIIGVVVLNGVLEVFGMILGDDFFSFFFWFVLLKVLFFYFCNLFFLLRKENY